MHSYTGEIWESMVHGFLQCSGEISIHASMGNVYALPDENVETTEEDRTINYPDGFDPSLVDKTYPARAQWVKDLKGQRLKHFECQTPIVKDQGSCITPKRYIHRSEHKHSTGPPRSY